MLISRLRLICILHFILLQSCNDSLHSSKKIFRFNQVDGVESLDPAFAKNKNVMWHVHQLYNRLIEYDTNMQITPSLAYKWSISPDRKTYTFYLRTNVYFHANDAFQFPNQRKLIAQDVVYSFSRLMNAKTASPGAWIFNNRVDSLTPFEAPNDSTFVLHLQTPFNPIFGILSMQYCSIVPREVCEKWGADFRTHPCGTGPFILETWDEGTVITLIKNTRYWEKNTNGVSYPLIDGIKATCIDSRATEFLLFMQGDIDFMNEIDASFKDQLLTKKGILKDEFQNKIQFQKHPQLNIEYLGILQDTALNHLKMLRDKRIRQAINYGFDRQKLVTYLRNNIGIPATAGFIPKGLQGYDDTQVIGYNYNPEKAKQLIMDYKNEGNLIESITLLTPDNYADRCNFIASQLRELGLTIQVEIMQASLLREQMSESKANFFRASWMADYPDAESYLTMYYSKNTAPPNYTRYRNAQYDKLYERSLIEKNDEEKIKLYIAMDKMIIADAPVVPVFYDEVMHFLNKRVKYFETNSLNMLELKKVVLD